MGSCLSTKKIHLGSSSSEASSSSTAGDCRTPEDIERVFKTFDGGTGFIKEDQFDAFVTQVLGAPFDADDRTEALAAASTGGLITFRAFMDWFRTEDEDDEPPEIDQVPESVRRGLKEDGVAMGADEDFGGDDPLTAAGFTDLGKG